MKEVLLSIFFIICVCNIPVFLDNDEMKNRYKIAGIISYICAIIGIVAVSLIN